jgi:hypothetical protein
MPQQTDSERMEVEDVVSSDPTTEDQAYMDDDEDGYYDEDEAREDDEPSAWAVKEELRRLLLTKNPSPATDLVCQTRSHRGKLHFSQSLRSLSISQFRPHSRSIWRGRSALLPSHLAGSQSSSQTKSTGRTPVNVPTSSLSKESCTFASTCPRNTSVKRLPFSTWPLETPSIACYRSSRIETSE